MNFYPWVTDWQLYKKIIGKNALPYDEYFIDRKNQQESAGVPAHRLIAERMWSEDGSPYYNVHPKMVSSLCKVDMKKIPSNLIRMPHGLNAVNIRFSQKHDEFTLHDKELTNPRLNQQFQDATKGMILSGSHVHGILMVNLNKSVLFIVDFNIYTGHNQPVYTIYAIAPNENDTLEDAINKAKGSDRSKSYNDVIDNVMRLCVSIGFLSDNPVICEPDVLSKDRSAFESGDDKRRKVIIERAKRRGKIGYNVGTDIMFVEPRDKKSIFSDATGREIKYAHIRSGHPHLVRYGKEKKLVKMMWYVPTVVRPDKPFKLD